MHNADHTPLRLADIVPAPVFAVAVLTVAFGAVILVGAFLTGASVTVAGAALLGAAALIAIEVRRSYPHGKFGACNAVTYARAAMVAFLCGAAAVVPIVSAWVVFTVAVVALALDGVDGWLARRSGLVSDFGARFDMETDAAFAAVLAVWLLVTGTTGLEILVLGFTRYIFVLASWVVPALRGKLPPSFRRKVICVVQIAALIALVYPLTWSYLHAPIAVTAAVLVLYSFAVDIRFLKRSAR